MKVFVTGAKGFVGTWLCRHLEAAGDEVVMGSSSEGFDVTNPWRVREAITAAKPDALYHLAAQSLVGESWKDPARTFEVNAMGTLHVLDAALACPNPPKVLLCSTSDVYGRVGEDEMPVSEDQSLAPVNPLAASKVAAEYLGIQAHLGTKLPVIRVRAFSHIGPDQPGHFLAPALAQRIVAAERTDATQLPVGNIEARRDYVDVRDLVRAYHLLVEKGVPGEVYNVCSGKDVSVKEIAERLLRASNIDLDIVVDPGLVRQREVSAIRGDKTRITALTGWEPEIKLDQTLTDILRHWRQAQS